jgi:hypothetical protein
MIGKKVTGKPRFQNAGPVTGVLFANVTPGQVAAFGTAGNAGKLGPAGANAQPFGVATTPGMIAGTNQYGTSLSGFPSFEPVIPENEVAFARRGAFYLLAAGAIAPGEFVKCAAAGAVVKWDPAADQAIAKVGQCIDPDGATNGAPVLIDLNIG